MLLFQPTPIQKNDTNSPNLRPSCSHWTPGSQLRYGGGVIALDHHPRHETRLEGKDCATFGRFPTSTLATCSPRHARNGSCRLSSRRPCHRSRERRTRMPLPVNGSGPKQLRSFNGTRVLGVVLWSLWRSCVVVSSKSCAVVVEVHLGWWWTSWS